MSTTPTPPMILVTTHASKHVLAYDPKTGAVMDGHALEKGGDLMEPRGIYLDPKGNILVVDGDKHASTVYFYHRPAKSGEKYGPAEPLITPSTANSIDHPFALAYDSHHGGDSAQAWVSNQDSNVVASFDLTLSHPRSASPDPTASYLGKFGKPDQFLQGTWVASAVDNLPGLPINPPVVKPHDGGLGASFLTKGGEEKVQNSVRDVILAGGVLLVADEVAGLVRLYDPGTGKYLGASTVDGDATTTLKSPTHLMASGDTIYVSTSTHIYSGTLKTSKPPELDLKETFKSPGGDISGMALDSAGNFYFADRTQKFLYAYTPGFAKQLWQSALLADFPEFLLLIEG